MPVLGPPLPYTLQGDVSARAGRIDEIDATALPASPTAGSIDDLLRAIELRAVSGTPAANSLVSLMNTMLARLPAPGLTNVIYSSAVIGAGGTGTGTIAAVDTTKSTVHLLGRSTAASTTIDTTEVSVVLTNGTTVTVAATTGGASVTVYFCVVVWAAAVSIQTGSVAITTGNLTATTTITAVTVGRAFLLPAGETVAVADASNAFAGLGLASSTSVSAARGANTTHTTTVYFSIVQY
ncbi:MAG: hypothetical protein KGK34_07220 [Chloroflexota bacterium]|nr:hypothetical protein [Chloroflexota bacterium]